MRAKLVRIGNSRGVRLPKPILEESGLPEDIEIKVEADRVVLMPARKHPREGWAESARHMVANGDDVDLWTDWDNTSGQALEGDWTWPEDFKWPDEPIVSTFISPPSTRSEAPKSPRRGPARSSRRTK
jgi:antitoxin MazE